MTFPQGQSFRGFQTAIAVIIQAGRTRSFTCGMGLSGTMHFFGSILVQVPPWEHYKVLSKYHCVLLLWFPSVIPALPLGLGTLEGNWAHYLNSKGYFIKRRTLFQKATSKKKNGMFCVTRIRLPFWGFSRKMDFFPPKVGEVGVIVYLLCFFFNPVFSTQPQRHQSDAQRFN